MLDCIYLEVRQKSSKYLLNGGRGSLTITLGEDRHRRDPFEKLMKMIGPSPREIDTYTKFHILFFWGRKSRHPWIHR